MQPQQNDGSGGTSSSFYQHMRQAYTAAPPQGNALSMSDIQHKLAAISSHAIGSQQPSSQQPSRALPPPLATPGMGTTSIGTPNPPLNNSRSPVQQQPVRNSASPRAVSVEGSAPSPGGPEDSLSVTELSTLRIVEFDVRVKVLANLQQQSNNQQMSLLCDDAVVKVFPKHVVFSKPSGSPVAELVILELNELTEDDARHALTFFLQRPDASGGVSVIEIICPNIHARSAIYKVVCNKRNILEQQAQRQGDSSSSMPRAGSGAMQPSTIPPPYNGVPSQQQQQQPQQADRFLSMMN